MQWTGYNGHIAAATVSQIKLMLNEGILNAIKHGQATRVQLGFRLTDGQIAVVIEDDGHGFDRDPSPAAWAAKHPGAR